MDFLDKSKIFPDFSMRVARFATRKRNRREKGTQQAEQGWIDKDHGNPTLLANYKPIALCNSFYQLINIIITSSIRSFTEKYAVLESSQHGFRGSRSVQLVIQKQRWLF